MPRQRPSLWVEIGLSLSLLTVAVSAIDAGVFQWVARQSLSDAATELALQSAAVIGSQVAAAGAEEGRRVVESHRAAGLEVTLFRADGHVLAGDPVAAPPTLGAVSVAREPLVTEVPGGIEVLQPVGAGMRAASVLRLEVGAVAARPAWAVVFGHAILTGGVVVVVGYLLFRRSVVGPLARMREAAREMALGDLAVKVSEDAPQELAELARALNTTARALAAAQASKEEQLAALARANEELTRAQEALIRTEKLASVGRLAAGLAHELGNPLTAVRGYLEFLVGSPELASEPMGAEILQRCQQEVERVHRILRQLLDFARDERRIGGAQRQVLALGALLEAAAEVVRPQPDFREVSLTVRAAPGVEIEGERETLHQVLVNLLLNAREAGGRRLQLLACRAEGGAEIVCSDDGHGIAAAHLPHIFEPFFTTRPPGEGTGLGLAIAHRVVEQHGGEIRVASEPGATKITIWLPARLPPDGGAPPTA